MGNDNFFILEKKTLWACGSNRNGELGVSDFKKRSQFVRVSISDTLKPNEIWISITAARAHTFLLTNQGRLFACGSNYEGQLGLGPKYFRPKFAYFMEVDLSKILIKNEIVVKVASEHSHTLLLTSKGRVLGSGCNSDKQLGSILSTHMSSSASFQPITLNHLLNAGERVMSIHAGWDYSVLLTNKNRVIGFGSNKLGQLGRLKSANQDRELFNPFKMHLSNLLTQAEFIASITVSGSQTLLLSNKGRVFVCGNNLERQLGIGEDKQCQRFRLVPLIDPIIAIHSSTSHTILETDKEQLLVCGSNDYGQLGTGDNTVYDTFTPLDLSKVLKPQEHISSIVVSYGNTDKGRFLSCGYTYTICSNFDDNYESHLSLAPLKTSFLEEPTQNKEYNLQSNNISC